MPETASPETGAPKAAVENAADPAAALLDAATVHVPFDGWSDVTLRSAARDAGVDLSLARALYPRGPLDLALAYHRRGDAEMKRRLAETELSDLPFRERIKTAIRYRLDAVDKELVRRGTTLFALPQNAAAGSKAIWGTADAIWTALGDTSDDFNWYSKRTILSGVYSATTLFWLGDDSTGNQATWDFLDRRIEEVMQFERAKSRVNESRLCRLLMAGPQAVLSRVRAPASARGGAPGTYGAGSVPPGAADKG